MTRIEQKLSALRARREKGFIAFITTGDPGLAETADAALRLEDAGVDILELGIPFSDPLADGRVNQESAARALAAGTTLDGVFRCVDAIRAKSELPLLFFSYINPLMAPGFQSVVRRAAEAGVDGFLMLDLPVEESKSQAAVLARHGLNNICLVAPTTPTARIRQIVRLCTGFAYCVSREGVTGMQKKLSPAAVSLIRRTKRLTSLPVAIGFGISTPEQAHVAAQAADAVVVGSAIVDRFAQAPRGARGRAAAAAWVGSLVRAVKRA